MNVYELALSLEEDMEKFYMEQAQSHNELHLKQVFLILSNEERKHAYILTENKELMMEKVASEEVKDDILEQAKKLFKGIKVDTAETARPKQLDVYRKALEMEERSIEFYKDLREKDPERKEIYKYLEKQEDKHCIILEEIIKLTSRPDEWVESAEFGPREDY
ncbi:MAG TPA: ferritin family protein [Clostridiales bacterium]|nr:ferritin family protein [Clostridiales bacterium]